MGMIWVKRREGGQGLNMVPGDFGRADLNLSASGSFWSMSGRDARNPSCSSEILSHLKSKETFTGAPMIGTEVRHFQSSQQLWGGDGALVFH